MATAPRRKETRIGCPNGLLGWGIDVQQLDSATCTVVEVGDRTNGRIYDMNGRLPDEVPARWFVRFGVDDADAAVVLALALGGTIQHEPWDSPFGRMSVITDTQGPAFGVIAMSSGK